MSCFISREQDNTVCDGDDQDGLLQSQSGGRAHPFAQRAPKHHHQRLLQGSVSGCEFVTLSISAFRTQQVALSCPRLTSPAGPARGVAISHPCVGSRAGSSWLRCSCRVLRAGSSECSGKCSEFGPRSCTARSVRLSVFRFPRTVSDSDGDFSMILLRSNANLRGKFSLYSVAIVAKTQTARNVFKLHFAHACSSAFHFFVLRSTF